MVSHCSLRDRKSPQVSRTLLSILADLNNAVVWVFSTRPLIFKSSSLCTNPLVTVPRTPITISITVTFRFHNFFNSLARPRYLSFFLLSFSFTQWSAGIALYIYIYIYIYITNLGPIDSSDIHTMFIRKTFDEIFRINSHESLWINLWFVEYFYALGNI